MTLSFDNNFAHCFAAKELTTFPNDFYIVNYFL